MTAKKTAKYTVEMTTLMTTVYEAAREDGLDNAEAIEKTVEGFNKTFGETLTVNVSMVRSKLVNLKVYVKEETRKIGGASATRKVSVVRAIETLLGLEQGALVSLEKARKEELELLEETLAEGLVDETV